MICIKIPEMDFEMDVSNWREQMVDSGLNEYDSCYAFLTDIKWKRGGVYFIYGTDGCLLYVGRSVNIKQRLIAHVTGRDPSTKDSAKSIARVSGFYVEDVADQEIYEAYAIKTLQPTLNKAKTSKIVGNYGVRNHVQDYRHGDDRYGQRGTNYNHNKQYPI